MGKMAGSYITAFHLTFLRIFLQSLSKQQQVMSANLKSYETRDEEFVGKSVI